MRGIRKGVGSVVFLAATFVGAMADPPPAPSAVITATGYALPVCTVGTWVKTSGAGTFVGGSNGVLTYDESDLVDANSMSVLAESKAAEVHIPVLCNTSMNWALAATKGAFRNDTTPVAPTNFSSQWLYRLDFGPKTVDGADVGWIRVQSDSHGVPIGGSTIGLDTANSLTVAYFALTFTPKGVVQRMTAGSYSELFTFTVAPGL